MNGGGKFALFIVFEGGDKVGKTSQTEALFHRLQDEGCSAVYTKEPGGALLGRLLHRWLSLPGEKLTEMLQLIEPQSSDKLPELLFQSQLARAEFLLFLLARAQSIAEVILPSLSQGKIVISDRYTYSSVAYQGYGRGLDLRLIEVANEIATQGIKPNIVFLLDIPPEEGLARGGTQATKDHFEEEELAFHRRVREGYLKMAAADPEHWRVIDARLPQKEIEELIWKEFERLIKEKPP
jgi:dTMP kinase